MDAQDKDGEFASPEMMIPDVVPPSQDLLDGSTTTIAFPRDDEGPSHSSSEQGGAKEGSLSAARVDAASAT